MKQIKEESVGASMTNPLVNLSVIGIFQVVEDAVTELLGTWQLDNVAMKKQENAVWVFAKSRIKRFKALSWRDAFRSVSFVSSITNAALCVDVAIRNEADDLCAYARVEMCALDLESGRIKKLPSLGGMEKIVAEAPEAEIAFSKYPAAELAEAGEVQIRYTNLDFSRHTNNVEYVRFMLNTYSARELEARPIREMQISYAKQSFENDVLTIRKGSLGERDLFVIQKEDQVIVKSEILF